MLDKDINAVKSEHLINVAQTKRSDKASKLPAPPDDQLMCFDTLYAASTQSMHCVCCIEMFSPVTGIILQLQDHRNGGSLTHRFGRRSVDMCASIKVLVI
jgi:hypothetical protein